MADPGNAGWQRDLSAVSRGKVGDALVAQGDLRGALAARRRYRETVAGIDFVSDQMQPTNGDVPPGPSDRTIGDDRRAAGDNDRIPSCDGSGERHLARIACTAARLVI